MAVQFVLFLITFAFCFLGSQCQEPCALLIKDYAATPVFRPLVYTESGKFYNVRDNVIKIPHGQNAVLSCGNNFFRNFPNQQKLTVKCNDDSLVVQQDTNSVFTFKTLNCDLKPIEEVKHEVSGCPKTNQGSYYQYYDVTKLTFNVLAEVCYDTEQERNVFTKIQLPAATTHQNNLTSNFNIPHRLDMLAAYRADRATAKIQTILTDDFNLVGETISTVKLLPATFFNEQLYDFERYESNYAAVWKTVADGNWKRAISDIKKYTENTKQPIEIIVGTHDVLSLTTAAGKEVELFLKDDEVPVPKYLWSVVHSTGRNQAVAIVTINNPFIRAENIKEDVFCENVCERIPWLNQLLKFKNYDRPIYGYTFCCNLNNFNIYKVIGTTSLLAN